MYFSLLFQNSRQAAMPRLHQEPAFFRDLNLGQVIGPILTAKKDYELESYYYTMVEDPALLRYRQDILKELDDEEMSSLLGGFTRTIAILGGRMDDFRETRGTGYTRLTMGGILSNAEQYIEAVRGLLSALREWPHASEGMGRLQEYLETYCSSEDFCRLETEASDVRSAFSGLTYSMLIRGGTIKVRKYEVCS